mmetsp:Transcript_71067/g.141208  ORF Transcript_71067/g.141208 Transcript_71067/m.141208 type:complete len:215 (-) Transcript_71067:641-1285(-)
MLFDEALDHKGVTGPRQREGSGKLSTKHLQPQAPLHTVGGTEWASQRTQRQVNLGTLIMVPIQVHQLTVGEGRISMDRKWKCILIVREHDSGGGTHPGKEPPQAGGSIHRDRRITRGIAECTDVRCHDSHPVECTFAIPDAGLLCSCEKVCGTPEILSVIAIYLPDDKVVGTCHDMPILHSRSCPKGALPRRVAGDLEDPNLSAVSQDKALPSP